MDDEIYREPWLSYQKLLKLEHQFESSGNTQKLWWLFRKAQAENLLYLHQDFEKTVADGLTLINDDTPALVSTMFKVFSGVIAQRQGRFQDSVRILESALKQAAEANLYHVYARGKQDLAYTRSLIELYETSLKELQEAYVEAFALEDKFLLAMINETYGAIYGYLGEYKKSVEYYDKALDTYEILGYRAHIAEATYGLASTYRYWKKYDLAIAKFDLYLQQISYTPNKDISFFGAYGLGMTLAEKGDCERANEVISQALLLNGQIDYNAELYKRQASCFVKLNQLQAAQSALDNAAEIFAGLPDLVGTKWVLEVQKVKSEIAYANKQYQGAYDLLDDYLNNYIELLNKKSSDRLVRVRAAMEVERNKVEIALLQQRNEVQQLEVETKQQRNELQSYIIAFSVLVILIILVAMKIQHNSSKKILALSVKDPLSNLYNRRYVFEYLAKLFEHLSPNKSELSLIMIDIDDFKQINDTYGHPFGDNVIREVAKVGQATLRAEDVMGRIGGEEFLCILPRTNAEHSKVIAQRMLEKIAQCQFSHAKSSDIQVTVSIGVASLLDDTTDMADLYEQADKALYQAKLEGKNSLHVYNEPEDELA